MYLSAEGSDNLLVPTASPALGAFIRMKVSLTLIIGTLSILGVSGYDNSRYDNVSSENAFLALSSEE
jgi:hypothetical protein